MVLPIIAYGGLILRKVATDISSDYSNLNTLTTNMCDTMNYAYGMGLAAPQIGLPIRLFVVDTAPFADDGDLTEEERTFLSNFKKIFINAKITEETGDKWLFNEGCLSIPGVHEDVSRQKQITIELVDEQFTLQRLTLTGLAARVAQHGYDHIEGILFTDKLSFFKKQLIKGKLTNISKGKVKVDYRMKFYKD